MTPLLLLALALIAPSASAQEGAASARLSWSRGPGAESCAPEEAIAAEVVARLGRDPFASETPSLRIEAIVTHDGAWRALIVVRRTDGTPGGERVLDSAAPTCASLDAAAALAVTLLIDPDALSREPAPAPEPAMEPGRALPTPEPPTTEPSVAPSPEPHPIGLSIGVLGAIGLAPDPAPGVLVDGMISLIPLLRLHVGLGFLPEQRAGELGQVAGLGRTFGRVGLELVVLDDVVGVGVGLDALIGAVHAVVYTLEPLTPGAQPWGAASASVRLRWRFADPVGLELEAGALVPFVRTRFAVEGGGPSYFEEPVAGWAALAIHVELR